jgi:protein-S-isoprenylcysteine O-methyltransferase Ste14
VMPNNLPATLVGLILAIYWMRVLHLAKKIRMQVGHSANVIPPGRFGCITRVIWFPLVFLWIAIPLSVPFIPNPPWLLRPLTVTPLLSWPALAVAIAAFILTLICWKKMGKSWRMGIDPNEKTSLVVTGPFAYVRHPIYALSSVLMLATVAIESSPLMIAVATIHLILLQLEARREEKYLAELHGSAYLDYCKQVRRFLPKI